MEAAMKRILAAIVLCLASASAAAQASFPAKPVRIVVPGGTGGVTDLRARWMGERLAREIGEPVVVENHPGASGNIGMEMAARSKPDGYTLVIVHQGTMALNPHLYAHLGYDPLRDFEPLTRLGFGPLMLAVNPKLGVSSVKELIELARTRRLNYGSPGVATPPHLAGELFKRETGIEATHIPYKGGGQEVTDLLGGHLDFIIEGITIVGPQVKTGHLKALAVTSRERVAAYPDVPTMREAGVPDYEYLGWVGIALPAGTPQPIADRLHDAIARVLATQEARDWFALAGADSTPDSRQGFARFIRAEYDKWQHVIREARITAE
jgi:tripartite-type tricarboxylate transporter receptor subunit TctC